MPMSKTALQHRIFYHEDVANWISTHNRECRLKFLLQTLAVKGFATAKKSTSGQILKWFRSNVKGYHYYLWWMMPSEEERNGLNGLGLRSGDILVRQIRHHDNHECCDLGRATDYFEFQYSDFQEEGYVGCETALTELQTVVQSREPIRVVTGLPGTGKTLALWRSIEAAENEKILYLTWSEKLAEDTRSRFSAYAPASVKVDVMTFREFIHQRVSKHIPEMGLDESRRLFGFALANEPSGNLGDWRDKKTELFSEIRGNLLGLAIPGERCGEANGIRHLERQAYVRRRKGKIPEVAAERASLIWSRIQERAHTAFPEFKNAARFLADCESGAGLLSADDYTQIVCDEIQDLAMVEISALLQYLIALESKTGSEIKLLLAGEEGQSVRPTGFTQRALNDLLHQKFKNRKKKESVLTRSLRTPIRIAGLLDLISEKFYEEIDKSHRPPVTTFEKFNSEDQATGLILHAEAPVSEKMEILQQITQKNDICFIFLDSPGENIPSEILSKCYTPETVKGLEFETVCLVDAGKFICNLLGEYIFVHEETPLFNQEARLRIDKFRVAVSRTTQALIFLDFVESPGDLQKNHGANLFLMDGPCVEPLPWDSVLPRLECAEQAGLNFLKDALHDGRANLDCDLNRAWTRARQTCGIYNECIESNEIACDAERSSLAIQVAQLAAQVLTRKIFIVGIGDFEKDFIGSFIIKLSKHSEIESLLDGYRVLRRFNDSIANPFEVFQCLLRPNSAQMFEGCLEVCGDQLIEKLRSLSTDPNHAELYDGELEKWLSLCGFKGDIQLETQQLRTSACEALIEKQRIAQAKRVFRKIRPINRPLLAKIRETEEQNAKAARIYERVGDIQNATKNWRLAGCWERVTPQSSQEAEDIKWILALQAHLQKAPMDIEKRLTQRERQILLLKAGQAVGQYRK
jgi:hypothetical protein